MSEERDRKVERAHGGIAKREGDMVTLGDGSRWWLNGEPWARVEVDMLVPQDRALVAMTQAQRRMERW